MKYLISVTSIYTLIFITLYRWKTVMSRRALLNFYHVSNFTIIHCWRNCNLINNDNRTAKFDLIFNSTAYWHTIVFSNISSFPATIKFSASRKAGFSSLLDHLQRTVGHKLTQSVVHEPRVSCVFQFSFPPSHHPDLYHAPSRFDIDPLLFVGHFIWVSASFMYTSTDFGCKGLLADVTDEKRQRSMTRLLGEVFE